MDNSRTAAPLGAWAATPGTTAPSSQAPPVSYEFPPRPEAAQHGEPVDLRWIGSPWDLTGLSFINFMLSLVTLGIYSFWGKTEVRRRLWSSVRLQGEPLQYTGTGKELFLGFLVMFFIFFIPVLLLSIGAYFVFSPEMAEGMANLLVYGILFVFTGVAIYRARRYRLSRTLWRGIRGGMSGKPWSFAGLWMWTTALLPLTLGWMAPQRAFMLQQRLHRETTFGNKNFNFDGSSGPLYPVFAALWIGGVILYFVTIGIVIGGIAAMVGGDFQKLEKLENLDNLNISGKWIAAIIGGVITTVLLWFLLSSWYQATKLMVFARATNFDNAHFKLNISGLGLIGLILSNFFLLVISLGILSPVAQARAYKYMIDRMGIDGTIDFAAIAQSQAAIGQGGEGLAQAFDVDAF